VRIDDAMDVDTADDKLEDEKDYVYFRIKLYIPIF
jgi:hypothetical protein